MGKDQGTQAQELGSSSACDGEPLEGWSQESNTIKVIPKSSLWLLCGGCLERNKNRIQETS